MAPALLTEVQLVLDVLRYEPASSNPAQMVAHATLLKARGLFLQTGTDGAWQGCVHAALEYQRIRRVP